MSVIGKNRVTGGCENDRGGLMVVCCVMSGVVRRVVE